MNNVSLVDGHIEEPKMTDEEIMKALECCCNYGLLKCQKCPKQSDSKTCMYDLSKDALDLINRKDAENERLKKILENRGEICKLCEGKYTEKIKRARAKAIKEFAERLKAEYIFWKIEDGSLRKIIPIYAIDYLVKEMVGD